MVLLSLALSLFPFLNEVSLEIAVWLTGSCV